MAVDWSCQICANNNNDNINHNDNNDFNHIIIIMRLSILVLPDLCKAR